MGPLGTLIGLISMLLCPRNRRPEEEGERKVPKQWWKSNTLLLSVEVAMLHAWFVVPQNNYNRHQSSLITDHQKQI